MPFLRQIKERLQSDADIASVFRTLEDTFGDHGFESICYFVGRPPAGRARPKVLSNYPDDWVAHYIDKDYGNIDVTFPTAADSIFPIRWDSMSSDKRNTKAQRDLFEDAKQFGMSNGITIPVHGPAGGFAALSIAGPLSRRELNSIWNEYHDELSLVAAYAHNQILIHMSDEDPFEPIRLTRRERECLTWAAQGKTAWESSQILGISDQTIIFHLNNCMRKLRVFSKHHAVVKAIMLGLILPEV